MKMKRNIVTLSTVLLFFCSINLAHADLLNDLFAGGSYQFDNLILNNWELVSSDNVNLDNIEISTGYGPNEFGVWSKNRELSVNQSGYGTPETLSLVFDFMVIGVGVNVTQVAGDLGFKFVSGYNYDSPYLTGSIAIGTSKGNSNLGGSTDFFSLNHDPGTVWIDIPGGLNEIWIRNSIYLNSSQHGYAEAGYLDPYGEGPAFRNRFTTAVVPIPGAVWLLGTGLIGLVGIRRKMKK
jgi:hypothetical protein